MYKNKVIILVIILVVAGFGCLELERNNPYDKSGSSYEQIVYVSAERGDPSNSGTKEKPLSTIQDGIQKAKTLFIDDGYDTAKVYVAEGTYTSDYSGTGNPVINMLDSISVYGGYSANFENRDIDDYETVVQDLSAEGGTVDEPNRAVMVESTVTSETILEGFSIVSGGPANYNSSVVIEGNCIIRSNTIRGLDSGYGFYTYGLYISGGATTIEKSLFTSLNASANTWGIYTENPNSLLIVNNIILPGSAVGRTYGIRDNNSTNTRLYNNIIDCGNGSAEAFCVYINESAPKINNNILTNISENGNVRGIYEFTQNTSTPLEVNNNNFWNVHLGTVLYRDNDTAGSTNISSTTLMETSLTAEGMSSSSNYDLDPVFNEASGNYHLTPSSPTDIKTSGLDGITQDWLFTDDKNGNTRTGNGSTGWSIGPYEIDN